MHNMDDSMRSGDLSSGVIKKKSSSGCLIIKKKGFGASGSKKTFDSSQGKKRSRLILTDSGSSDELSEPVKRKVVDKYGNGSVSYTKSNVEHSRMPGFESERKRSGLDVFEFDEYDGFDGKKMRRDYMDDRLNLSGRSGGHREAVSGSSRNVVLDKRKDIYYERRNSMAGGKSKGLSYSSKSRYDTEEDESHLPISYLREKYREAPSEPIRLQGKNGVLKVMVNKKKKQGFPDKNYDYREGEDRKGSRSEAIVKKNEVIRPSFYSDSKRPEKPVSSVKREKGNLDSRKALSILSIKAEDSGTDDSDTSLKQETRTQKAHQSKKAVKNETKRTPPTESSTPLKGKESKIKRGNGTEKQLLREKIRTMLLDRGWTIDYRPRRNRDYLDAVYINPSGTAYWSIIKAYDALQKQLEEEDDDIKPSGDSTPFTPLPEEIISKLTRQTRKKIEREMKKKKRDAGFSKSAKEVSKKEFAEGTDSEQHEDKLSFYMKQNHKSLKGRLHDADHVSANDSSDSLHKGTSKQDRSEKPSVSNSRTVQGRKSRKIGRCTLLVRSSDKGLNSETDGYVPYTGKRTLLSWLIDCGIVQLSEKVQYMNRKKTRVMLEGWITKDGIHCGCCSKILTISKFEIHAGSKQRQPFPNIYLESGLSLMECQIDAWNRPEEAERRGFHNVDVDGDDPNDDTCGLCGDGGDLICCDGCPSTFHLGCLDIQMLPAGDWHCPNCTCKFCGSGGSCATAANDITDSSLMLCNLCEKKYHQSCNQEEDDLSVYSGVATYSFCGKKCQEVFVHLQKLLGVKHELESGFSWSLVHRMDPASEALHLGFPQRVECNSKLAVALSVMDECFLPIVDRRSGINLIHNVLYNYGSNFNRLNYRGFYTAILERGDEIISAASIRIHSTQLAEMPFIGTRHIYRRQGMCRRLLCAIETALGTLKVEKLIIPAIAEHMHTWTESFGFSPLEESHKQEMKSMNMLVFPGTDMLQKLLVKRDIAAESITAGSVDVISSVVKEDGLMLPVVDKKSELDSSPEHDLDMPDNSAPQPSTEISKKAAATSSDSETPVVSSNEIPVISNTLISSHELINEETLAINSKSTFKLTAVSPSNESSRSPEAKNSVLAISVEDNTQSKKDDVMDDALKENVRASPVKLVPDSLGNTSASNTAEELTVSVCAVTLHDTLKSSRIDSALSNQKAADLDDSCEVNVKDNNAKPPVESAVLLSAKDTVNENVAAVGTNIHSEGGSMGPAGDNNEVNDVVAFAEPVVESSKDTLAENNASQESNDNPAESSCAMEGVVDVANVNLGNCIELDELADVQEEAVEVCSHATGENPADSSCTTDPAGDETNRSVEFGNEGAELADAQKIAVKVSSQGTTENPTQSSLVMDGVGYDANGNLENSNESDDANGDLENSNEGDECNDAQKVDVKVASQVTGGNPIQSKCARNVVGDEMNRNLESCKEGDKLADAQEMSAEVYSPIYENPKETNCAMGEVVNEATEHLKNCNEGDVLADAQTVAVEFAAQVGENLAESIGVIDGLAEETGGNLKNDKGDVLAEVQTVAMEFAAQVSENPAESICVIDWVTEETGGNLNNNKGDELADAQEVLEVASQLINENPTVPSCATGQVAQVGDVTGESLETWKGGNEPCDDAQEANLKEPGLDSLCESFSSESHPSGPRREPDKI